MKRGLVLGMGLALAVFGGSGLASAQEAPAANANANANDGAATGFMLQARLQGQAGVLPVSAGPGFLLGYKGSSYALGVGLTLNRIGLSANGDDASLTLVQVMPTALIDVWRSKDGRARANVIGGIGYGRASFSGTNSFRSCVVDVTTGTETCSTTEEDFDAGVGYVPFMLGFGGDYFLSRNFALGAELGIQAAFTTDISESSGDRSSSVDGSSNLQLAYGALRATFVLGD